MNNIFTSIFSGLGSMIAWGTGDIFVKKAAEKVGSFGLFLWVQIIGLCLVTILFVFLRPKIDFSTEIGLLLIVSAISGVVAYMLIFKAYQVGNVTVVSPINSAYTIFTIPTAILVLHKTVSLPRLIAVFVVIAGVIIVSLNFTEIKKGNFDLKKGVKEIFLAIILIGLVIVPLNDYILGKVNWVVFSLLSRVVGTIVALVLLATVYVKRGASLKPPNKTFFIIFMFSFLDFLALSFYQYGLANGNVIIVTPISSGFTVVTILLSVIFLKEKLSYTQIFGIILAVTGIITLSII